jgi:hypothetical protein
MKIFAISTEFGSYPRHCVVAENMAQAERIFKAKYQFSNITKIELYSEYVQIQGYDEQAEEKPQ